MINLHIDNSYCQIEGLGIGEHKDLAELLSYELDPQAAFFSGSYGPKRRSLLGRRGDFPSGLLHIVVNYLKLLHTPYNKLDRRVRPVSTPGMFRLNSPVQPYPEQTEAIEHVIRAGRGTISAVTGFGKSLTMAFLINALQVKTLVIVPNLNLKSQLTTTFEELFGSLKNITIENIDSPKLDTASDYDMLIIDESHHVAASTYRRLNKKVWNKIYHRVFFTGTPFRSRDEEQLLMESISGRVVYRIDYKTAVDKGYIVPLEAYYYDVPKKATNGYSWAQVYAELVTNNTVRNELIADLLFKIHAKKIPTLCLVKEIAHGEILSGLSGAAFAHGQNEETPWLIEQFKTGKLTTLIGTTGVLGEGVDTRPAEVIIIAGLGKSRNSIMQQCGRGFRRYPGKESAKIIIFNDKSHKWPRAHFKTQCKIIEEEYGVKIVKL